jgi:hypothetical protein
MNSPGRRKELDEEQELLDSLDRTLYYGNSKWTPDEMTERAIRKAVTNFNRRKSVMGCGISLVFEINEDGSYSFSLD